MNIYLTIFFLAIAPLSAKPYQRELTLHEKQTRLICAVKEHFANNLSEPFIVFAQPNESPLMINTDVYVNVKRTPPFIKLSPSFFNASYPDFQSLSLAQGFMLRCAWHRRLLMHEEYSGMLETFREKLLVFNIFPTVAVLAGIRSSKDPSGISAALRWLGISGLLVSGMGIVLSNILQSRVMRDGEERILTTVCRDLDNPAILAAVQQEYLLAHPSERKLSLIDRAMGVTDYSALVKGVLAAHLSGAAL